MATAVKSIFKPSKDTSAGLQAQADAIAKKEANVAAAEEGQRKSRRTNRGLLAFVDDDLYSKLGGA